MILAAAVALQRRRIDSVFRFVRERLCYAELRAIETTICEFFLFFVFCFFRREGRKWKIESVYFFV